MGSIRSLFRRRHGGRSKASSATTSSPTSPTAVAAGVTDELERVFKKFDTNGDGKISSSELAAIFQSLGHPVTDEELERMMGEADTDGDGFISFDEFVDLNVRTVDDSAALEDLRQAFSVFDLDRNGSISADELARVLRSIGEGASVAQCKRMIDGVDRDGDGLISFEEFRLMMANGSGFPLANKIE
ncbi:probable calcium-binding protein CML15 [Elaeis guineensis]|uniref:Probable calcium-binding protein CML10 n=1 Tax=Elaeis guineensis var. tenera TaxID=51953 RepID=A0A6I9QER8_ELAGV|nr:probable calcium-binding protein CML10 [Elaeis guineensis]